MINQATIKILRNKPRLTYCGLTIILSNPSRFDTLNLLSSTGGVLFNNHCLKPELNIMQCDVRLMDDKSPFLPNTKCIMLLGEAAMHYYCPSTMNNSLNEIRGSPLSINGIMAVASFFPQDAADVARHEQRHNVNSKEYEESNSEDREGEDDEGDEGDTKAHGRTRRKNYAFWLSRDTKKVIRYLFNGGTIKSKERSPLLKLYPSSEEVVNILTNTKNGLLILDIETDYEEQNLQCFAFSFDFNTVYSVPILNHNYALAYSSFHLILRALAIAMRDNVVIGHNISNFDLFVLATKYHIGFTHAYDTMIAMHRCYPDVERSLGHCVSLWTDEFFHKDTDSQGYKTHDQMMARLKYCAKDVYTTGLVYKAIEQYSTKIPGLKESIKCGNDSIKPYLITSIQGIRYSEEKVNKLKDENDRLMMQYLRIIKLLIGDQGMEDVKKAVKGKAKAFPSSNSQCTRYFHELLEYPILFKSKKTGKPSLGKKLLYKLALKHNNPVITFTLLYRIVQKEYGALKFYPWKGDNNKIVPYTREGIEKYQGIHEEHNNLQAGNPYHISSLINKSLE